jgi:hypothetical protein
MASKAAVIKFDKIDQSTIKGKWGHTRTGACTSKGRCFHGMKQRNGRKGGK